jgi:hypothetical protein
MTRLVKGHKNCFFSSVDRNINDKNVPPDGRLFYDIFVGRSSTIECYRHHTPTTKFVNDASKKACFIEQTNTFK